MDKIDKQILAVLQHNARISNADLAGQVNLSATPCLRRVKRLEQEGYIERYSAELSPAKLGLDIAAFVSVQLERNSVSNAAKFESAVGCFEEVIACYVLAGNADYMLHVVCKDLISFERFIKEKLANVPQIAKLDTTIVLNQIKQGRDLPIV